MLESTEESTKEIKDYQKEYQKGEGSSRQPGREFTGMIDPYSFN